MPHVYDCLQEKYGIEDDKVLNKKLILYGYCYGSIIAAKVAAKVAAKNEKGLMKYILLGSSPVNCGYVLMHNFKKNIKQMVAFLLLVNVCNVFFRKIYADIYYQNPSDVFNELKSYYMQITLGVAITTIIFPYFIREASRIGITDKDMQNINSLIHFVHGPDSNLIEGEFISLEQLQKFIKGFEGITIIGPDQYNSALTDFEKQGLLNNPHNYFLLNDEAVNKIMQNVIEKRILTDLQKVQTKLQEVDSRTNQVNNIAPQL